MAEDLRHGIVNVSQRGILGGWVHYCSCGASIIEPEGGHEATDAHLAGPPDAPRPRKTRHFTDAELAAHDAQVKAEALQPIATTVEAMKAAAWDKGWRAAIVGIPVTCNPYRAAETEATR